MRFFLFFAVFIFAQGAWAAGSLWRPDPDGFPSLLVMVPEAIECWANNEPVADSPCWHTGLWYGYAINDASTEVKLEGEWRAFVDGVSLAHEADGSSLIDSDALRVRFTADAAVYDYDPTIAGIGFNFKQPDGPQNISNYGGYCLTYTSSNEAVQFELGWDENEYGLDTWYATLPASANKKTVDLTWDYFVKDGRAKGTKDQPITTATNEAYSVKIRLKNGTSSAVETEFALYQLGWLCECSVGLCNQSITQTFAMPNLSIQLNGKSFTIQGQTKPETVRMYNIKGKKFINKTVMPNESVSISHLPSGVYMVKIGNKTQRFVVR